MRYHRVYRLRLYFTIMTMIIATASIICVAPMSDCVSIDTSFVGVTPSGPGGAHLCRHTISQFLKKQYHISKMLPKNLRDSPLPRFS